MANNFDTQYRADGNFFVVRACRCCDEQYFIHAMSNSIVDSGFCARCENEIELLENIYGEPKEAVLGEVVCEARRTHCHLCRWMAGACFLWCGLILLAWKWW